LGLCFGLVEEGSGCLVVETGSDALKVRYFFEMTRSGLVSACLLALSGSYSLVCLLSGEMR
jgi:hypothetical protein